MRDLSPPPTPETPEFRQRLERILRRAIRDRQTVPGLRWLGIRWSTAPGTAVVGVLAVTFFLNVPLAPTPSDASLPHWTAPAITVPAAPLESEQVPSRHGRRIVVEAGAALIDGQFDVDEFRESDTVESTPSTIPQ